MAFNYYVGECSYCREAVLVGQAYMPRVDGVGADHNQCLQDMEQALASQYADKILEEHNAWF